MKIIYCVFATFCITANAFAMADRTPPVYGVPTLYGEYEVFPDDTHRAAKMYGDAPVHPAAIRGTAIKNTSVAKHPVKAKKTAAKKKTVKKKTVKKSKKISAKTSAKAAKELPMPKEIEAVKEAPIAQTEAKKPTSTNPRMPVASQDAIDIATRAAHRVDIDSFCIQKKPQGRGNLPDGIIMMPGRPDLMSCTTPNQD